MDQAMTVIELEKPILLLRPWGWGDARAVVYWQRLSGRGLCRHAFTISGSTDSLPLMLVVFALFSIHSCFATRSQFATGFRLSCYLVATGASFGEQNCSSIARPSRPFFSVLLGLRGFVRQRTSDSQLVPTGETRLSN